MMTDPAAAIKREVHQLVDLQIEKLRQPSRLTASDLSDYRVRSEKNHDVVSRTGPDTKSPLREAIAQSILRVRHVWS